MQMVISFSLALTKDDVDLNKNGQKDSQKDTFDVYIKAFDSEQQNRILINLVFFNLW